MISHVNLLRVAMFTAALVAAQLAQRPAHAAEATDPALQTPVAQTSTVAALRNDAGSGSASGNRSEQSQPNIPTEMELVTGDGQQGSVSGKPVDCRTTDAGCKP